MIIGIQNVTVYPNGELSNDDYHGEKYKDYASGSELFNIFAECPADAHFGEKEQSAALHFGTASHAAMLEPDLFEEQFARKITKSDDENYLTSDAGIKKFIKDHGIPGYSNKPFYELVQRAINIDPDVKILALDDRIQELNCEEKQITLVKGEDHDNIMQMRRALFADESNLELFKGATVETSIFCELLINDVWHKVKVRPDIITHDCVVPDYKTTARMNPEQFARQAHEAGYWFKQAFTCDILSAVYSKHFKAALLAQGKKSPFIHQLYYLTDEQLQVGREQYISALIRFDQCKKTDVWPAYFDGPVNLPTSDYIAKRYGFN